MHLQKYPKSRKLHNLIHLIQKATYIRKIKNQLKEKEKEGLVDSIQLPEMKNQTGLRS